MSYQYRLTNSKSGSHPDSRRGSPVAREHVLICVAWPYANGPLHLGHVAGCYLPPDIQFRFERARGNRVLMVSGSDEHGTPITLTAEQMGVDPQEVVDRFHSLNTDALLALGCAWEPNIDPRGVEYGGALFNRTSDVRHKELVQQNFLELLDAGLFERREMQQYYEVRADGTGRFLPDRYVEGECPNCSAEGARGDQCDQCGTTYESTELINPKSKMHPAADIEVRDTEHFFYRLDLFQKALEQHTEDRWTDWKANVRSMTRNWLEMGLRPRAVTRDLEWGIDLPLEGDEWSDKCVYVWFEAVQGYYSCARIWAERHAADAGHIDGDAAWERWWRITDDGREPRHLYFLGKDNIPFHTIIWPAIIMGLNHAAAGNDSSTTPTLPGPGDLQLEQNVPGMEYLMMAGAQFSKSRGNTIPLTPFLERYGADALRYHLSINMPENHDTDFTWPDFVDKVNNELIATYGNFIHRVLTLAHRLNDGQDSNPLLSFDDPTLCSDECTKLEELHAAQTDSLTRHRFKEALRAAMSAAQFGNQMLQSAAPWEHMKGEIDARAQADSFARLALGWRLCRYLAITTQPFMPAQAQRVWESLGEVGQVSEAGWDDALDWSAALGWNPEVPQPLFQRLDLDEILAAERALAGDDSEDSDDDSTQEVKDGMKDEHGSDEMDEAPEGTTWLDYSTFTQMELRTGRIESVEDHPDADNLYVIHVDDGSADGRTLCAGLKPFYSKDGMAGMTIVFVANLEPRKLRGILSEGMLLAAEDDDGNVRLVTVDGDISPGSSVH